MSGSPQSFWVRVAAFSLWLVFLAYLIGDLVHGRIRGPEAAVAWAGVVLFVGLYELVVWRFPWGQPWAIGVRLRG